MFRRTFAPALCAVAVIASAGSALARPTYGNANCSDCHSSAGFGNTVTNRLVDVVSGTTATIPNGAFGDPDRGEGPLASFSAAPGTTFQLTLSVKDPTAGSPSFAPNHYAVALRNFFTTDPDYQAGDTNTANWDEDMLQIPGATPFDIFNPPPPGPGPIPTGSADWWRHADTFGGALDGSYFYTSIAESGHDWFDPIQGGPQIMTLDIFVPAGVIPGWYDLTVSAQGVDFTHPSGFFAFYDEEHFYLEVTPEPATALLLGFGLLVRRRRR